MAGAETKALPCWVKNTEFAAVMAPAIAALAAPGGTAAIPTLAIGVLPPVWVVIQFGICAKADDADSSTATVVPTRTLVLRTHAPRDLATK